VRPKLYGIYESTRARIKYGNGAVEIDGVDPDVRRGYSTSLGRIKIMSAAEYARKTSYHMREFLVFGLLYSVPLTVPFFLWRATRAVGKRISKPRST
jgi:hypothetical protein